MRPARKNRKIEENKSGLAGKRGERVNRVHGEESNRGGRPGRWGGGGRWRGGGRKKRKRHRGTSRRIIRVAACAYAPLCSLRSVSVPRPPIPFRNASLYFSLSLSLLPFLLPLPFFRSFFLPLEDIPRDRWIDETLFRASPPPPPPPSLKKSKQREERRKKRNWKLKRRRGRRGGGGERGWRKGGKKSERGRKSVEVSRGGRVASKMASSFSGIIAM